MYYIATYNDGCLKNYLIVAQKSNTFCSGCRIPSQTLSSEKGKTVHMCFMKVYFHKGPLMNANPVIQIIPVLG